MNTFQQQESLLIGSMADIRKLSEKDSATILVVSDSHGSYENLYTVLNHCGRHCDALVFCGDGMSDFVKLVSAAVDNPALQKNVPPVVGIVGGNNDSDIYVATKGDGDDFFYAQYKVPLVNSMCVCSHTIAFSHGHRYALYCGVEPISEVAANLDAEIMLFGHTHIAMSTVSKNNTFLLNPGSCYLPRGGQPKCFATLKLEKGKSSFEEKFYEFSYDEYRQYTPEYIYC